MTDTQETAAPTPTPENATAAPDDMDAADRAAYEAFQAQLRENRERRAEAERLRLQAAALEAGAPLTAATEGDPQSTLVKSWDIDNEDVPAILTQYDADNRPIARTVLDQETVEGLLGQLNLIYVAPEAVPLTWAVRYPDYGNIPILTLFRGAEAIGSLPLDEEFGKPVGAILASIYPTTPRVPLWQRFKAWVRKHPVWSVLIALVALPFVAITLYGVFINLIGYI
jgi:hypothetical protein